MNKTVSAGSINVKNSKSPNAHPREVSRSLPTRQNALACDRCNDAHCLVMRLGGTGCLCTHISFRTRYHTHTYTWLFNTDRYSSSVTRARKQRTNPLDWFTHVRICIYSQELLRRCEHAYSRLLHRSRPTVDYARPYIPAIYARTSYTRRHRSPCIAGKVRRRQQLIHQTMDMLNNGICG